jgi:hypothetical protein
MTLVTEQYMDLVFTLQDAWPIVHGSKDASLMKSWTVLLRETGDFASEPPVISVALNERLYAALEAGGPLIARSLCRRSLREKVEHVLTIHKDLRQPPASAGAERAVETAPATPAATHAVPASVAAVQKETLEAIDALFKGGDFHALVQASGLDARLTAAVVKGDRAGAEPDGLAKALEAFNRIAAGEEEAMILDTRLREVRVGLNQAISARMGVHELMMGVLDRLADGDDYNDVVEETGIKARVAEAIAERSIQQGRFIVVREMDADGERWVTSHDSEANAENFRSDAARDGYPTSPVVEVPCELAAVGEPLMTFASKLVAATTRFEYPANSQQIDDRGARHNEVPRG